MSSGGRVRIAFDRRTGATGDLKYLSREACDTGNSEEIWDCFQISISFGLPANHPEAKNHSSPGRIPIFISDNFSRVTLGDAQTSLLNTRGLEFERGVQGQLLTNPKMSNTLATLVQEVRPAITALRYSRASQFGHFFPE